MLLTHKHTMRQNKILFAASDQVNRGESRGPTSLLGQQLWVQCLYEVPARSRLSLLRSRYSSGDEHLIRKVTDLPKRELASLTLAATTQLALF